MIERFHRELLNFLARRVGDRDLAADLTQESFARVYSARAAGTAEAVDAPRALLFTTARHLLIDHHRRSTVRVGVEVMSAHEKEGESDWGRASIATEPEVVLSGRERLAAIESVVAALPPRPREAFVLYKLDGLSRAEVARSMGISVKTVESHLAVAMAACLARLQTLDGLSDVKEGG